MRTLPNTIRKILLAPVQPAVCCLCCAAFLLLGTVGLAAGEIKTLADIRGLPRIPESVGLPVTVRGVVLQKKGGRDNDE